MRSAPGLRTDKCGQRLAKEEGEVVMASPVLGGDP